MTAHIKGTQNRSHLPECPIESRRAYTHSDRSIASLLTQAESLGTITLSNGRSVSCDRGYNSAHAREYRAIQNGGLPKYDRPTTFEGKGID